MTNIEDNIGIVVSGTFSQGMNVKLNSQNALSSLTIGSHVVIDTLTQRFMCEVSDIGLRATDQRVEHIPLHMQNERIFQSLIDNAAYAFIEVTPRLILSKENVLGGNSDPVELPSANTIPPHFSPVFKPTEADYEQVFYTREGKGFSVGNPLDLDTQINLDMELLVQRSSAIFGKSGSGKSFLTKILLAGMLQKSGAASLIFDYAGEYAYEGFSEENKPIKGLAQLFKNKVVNYTIDKRRLEDRKVGAEYLNIPKHEIEPDDIALLRNILNMNENQMEAARIVYEIFKTSRTTDWIHNFVHAEEDSDQMLDLVSRYDVNPATIGALKRRLRRIDRLEFLTDSGESDDVVKSIIDKLKNGLTVILDFPRDELSYILIANMLTRRIHSQWRYEKENYTRDRNKYKDPVPLVITIEEAHNFLNKDVSNRTTFGTIAREARKYNVTLMVVDQRPSGIDDEIMSQIENKFICKLDDPRDIDSIFSGVPHGNRMKTSLRSIESKQHALAFGEAIPMPIIFKVRNYGQDFYSSLSDESLFPDKKSEDEITSEDLY